MKKSLVCIILLITTSISGAFSQSRGGLYGHRAGAGYSIIMIEAAPAYLFGDVGGKMQTTLFKGTTFNPSSIRALGGVSYRYIFPNNLSVKLNALYGYYYGTDAQTSFDTRAYTVKSGIFEFSFQGEMFLLGGPRELGSSLHSLYLFTGAGMLIQNPVLTGNSRSSDKIVQGVNTTPVLPFGVGYEYYIGRGLSVGVEGAFRYSVGDFLDGLKTPFSDNNDVITNIGVTVSYNFSIGSSFR